MITESKLFSDSMQITRRQGNIDDADGAIVNTDSVIWISCLTVALQELVKDLLPLTTEVSGTTSTSTEIGKTIQVITKPIDLIAIKYLYVNDILQKKLAHSDIFSVNISGYTIEGDNIYINESSSSQYTMKYYNKWPTTSGVIDTDFTILDDNYYMCLLWQTIKQIYLFYEDIDGANVASGIYDRIRDNIPGTAITPIMTIHSSRG